MLRGKCSIYLAETFVLAVVSFMAFGLAMAATFQVNSQSDAVDVNPGDGLCETSPGNGVCTLRAAVQEHNALGGTNTINLPTGIYTLTIFGSNENSGASGDLDITTGVLTMDGSGAGTTIIQAGTETTNGIDRVFHVVHRSTTVSLSGMTVRYGRVSEEAGYGGGIYNEGTLNLTNVTVSDNSSGASGYGGGIYSDGVLDLDNCTIVGNKGGWGGGIFLSGTASVINSLISDNSTTAGSGGGIFTVTGALTIRRSRVSGNTTVPDYSGGGIFSNADFILTESTVSGNESGSGGGICNQGNATITNSTISGNIGTSSDGAGVLNTASDIASVSIISSTISNNTGIGVTNWRFLAGSFRLKNVLVANHTVANCSGTITSDGHNLDSGDTCGLSGPGDLQGIDPLLGRLQDNGGPTFTHALLTGSPAIDAADPDSFPSADQRGVTRPQGAGPDIGAYELGPISPDGGTVGTEITISGPAFGIKKGKIFVGPAALKILAWTGSSIRGRLMSSLPSGTYDVTIRPQGKGPLPITIPNGFTVKGPEIDSVNPTTGSIGDEITINGFYFGSRRGKVSIGNKNCRILLWKMNSETGESEIHFMVPKGLGDGTREVKVSNGAGGDTAYFAVGTEQGNFFSTSHGPIH